MKKSWGVIISRCQPIHNGHIMVLKTALRECDNVLFVIGSKNKQGTKRNPLSYEYRNQIVQTVLDNEFTGVDKQRIKLFGLCDWSTESSYNLAKSWGRFFYYNIVNAIQSKEFVFYYNDDESIIRNWFEEDIWNNIEVRQINRSNISSTNIRQAIMDFDEDYLRQALPMYFVNYDFRFAIYNALYHSKDEDWIM